ncbi:class I SAM-dependent methyltransferase [Ornithinimicrobium sp. Y1847]|uniref:class I SAM-dependent methyltransferase n=1 Tax=unclassified Ornithinimicrobium TaxID=2615080 RepID=UPI003B6810DF
MTQDHYFTAQPASDGELRRVPVRLAGRDIEVVTAGGIFSPDGIDKGTRVLLDEVPAPPANGTFLDLGCGWGPLALTLALESPAAAVHAVDVNERALDLARRNARALGVDASTQGAAGVHASTPDEVDAATTFDLIWSNPPIRVGKAALHELLTTWLPRLRPASGLSGPSELAGEGDHAAGGADPAGGGTAYLVVQKNLGSDSLQTWLARALPDIMGAVRVERCASSKGFRVLKVQRTA